MKRPFVILVVLVVAATWATMAAVEGLPSTIWDGVIPILSSIGLATGLSFTYQKRLWHWRLVQQLLAKTPDLRGAWKVTIRPAWTDPSKTGEKKPVEGYAQIDQTASSFCMRLFTKDSRSETFAFSIDEMDGEFRLTVAYENSPRMRDRPRKGTSHQGAAIYRFRGYGPNVVSGEYWTELMNVGEIELRDRTRREISSFEDGKQVFS